MKLDITGKKIVRDFQRRRRIILAIIGIAGLLGVVLVGNLVRMVLPGGARAVGITAVFLPLLGIVVSFLIASILFFCPNCWARPWTNGGFCLDPKVCGGCRARLKD